MTGREHGQEPTIMPNMVIRGPGRPGTGLTAHVWSVRSLRHQHHHPRGSWAMLVRYELDDTGWPQPVVNEVWFAEGKVRAPRELVIEQAPGG